MSIAAFRPQSNYINITKLFIIFAITFAIVHQIVLVITEPLVEPPKPVTTASSNAKNTRVETSSNDNLQCSSDNSKEAQSTTVQKKKKKDVQYYLENFGVQQTIDGNAEENIKMREVQKEMEQYLQNWIIKYEDVESLKEKCINQHDKCVFWSSIGECKKNPGYMDHECMLACGLCERLL